MLSCWTNAINWHLYWNYWPWGADSTLAVALKRRLVSFTVSFESTNVKYRNILNTSTKNLCTIKPRNCLLIELREKLNDKKIKRLALAWSRKKKTRPARGKKEKQCREQLCAKKRKNSGKNLEAGPLLQKKISYYFRNLFICELRNAYENHTPFCVFPWSCVLDYLMTMLRTCVYLIKSLVS